MKDEEIKAIERLKRDINTPLACGDITTVIIDDLETVLNMINEYEVACNCGKQEIETLNFTIRELQKDIKKPKAEIETLKRDFEIVDHECSRLEQEDIRKDEQIEQYINMLATNDMLHVLECEKKDKIIDLMAEYIYDRNAEGAICSELWKKDCEPCIPCIKEYFENKVKESK